MRIPKVFIVVLNWNGVKDTLECLESLSSLDYSNFEIIVVDNGSKDRSVEIIRRRYPELTLIENPINLGYTGGNNIGIQYAMTHGAQYIWILNNDTIVESDSLRNLIHAAEEDSKTGILSPVIYYIDQRDRMQFCGTFFDAKRGKITEELKDGKNRKTNVEGFVFLLYGTAMLINRKVIKKIGKFDDNFFAYFEDYDYSLRANLNSFQCKVVNASKIYHKDASSTGGTDSPIKTYFYYRNFLLFYKKHIKGAALIKLKYKIIRMAIGAAAMFRSEGKHSSAYACLDGIWDGMKGSGGPKKKRNQMPLILKKVLFFFHSHGKRIKSI